MSVNIIEQIVPFGGNRPGGIYKKTHITIHETGNYKPDATAKSHANWMSNGSNGEVGYQYTVDDTEAYHHIPDNERAWHAGDGPEGEGNCHSIGIEICVNAGGNFEQAKKNAAWLAAKKAKEYGIPLENIVQHNHWSGKNCPETIRETNTWNAFLKDCERYYNGENTPVVTGEIKENDVVTIADNAVYYTGGNVPAWVKAKRWVVDSVKGDRAVINKSEDGKNAINSPINVKYLTVAKDNSFLAKVTADALNIRAGAGTNYKKVGTIKDKGTYTIVETKSGTGSKAGWGKLKSKVGWISLDYVEKV